MNVIEFATSRSWSSWVTLTASLAIIVFLLHRFRDPRVDTTTSEPTVAPYTIPHFQHLIAFLWNPGKLYRSMQAEYSGRPFTLWLNNTKFHVFFDPSTVNHVFGRSRAFSFDPVLASMMGNAVMLPPDDLLKFCPPAELRGKDRANSRKYIMSDHSIWSKFLTGEPLDELMRAFLRNFNIVLEQHLDPHSADWQTVDINELVKRSIFETTVLTFYGPRLKQIWGDNMWDDWKTYDRATYIGVRSKLAITLQPRVYFAYKRMMAAFEEWIDSMNYRWPDTDKVWDDKWGARMIWERDRLAVESGFSFRGRACLQASCLFA
jgi:oxysterol 7-alpha-hydroxylase